MLLSMPPQRLAPLVGLGARGVVEPQAAGPKRASAGAGLQASAAGWRLLLEMITHMMALVASACEWCVGCSAQNARAVEGCWGNTLRAMRRCLPAATDSNAFAGSQFAHWS